MITPPTAPYAGQSVRTIRPFLQGMRDSLVSTQQAISGPSTGGRSIAAETFTDYPWRVYYRAADKHLYCSTGAINVTADTQGLSWWYVSQALSGEFDLGVLAASTTYFVWLYTTTYIDVSGGTYKLYPEADLKLVTQTTENFPSAQTFDYTFSNSLCPGEKAVLLAAVVVGAATAEGNLPVEVYKTHVVPQFDLSNKISPHAGDVVIYPDYSAANTWHLILVDTSKRIIGTTAFGAVGGATTQVSVDVSGIYDVNVYYGALLKTVTALDANLPRYLYADYTYSTPTAAGSWVSGSLAGYVSSSQTDPSLDDGTFKRTIIAERKGWSSSYSYYNFTNGRIEVLDVLSCSECGA